MPENGTVVGFLLVLASVEAQMGGRRWLELARRQDRVEVKRVMHPKEQGLFHRPKADSTLT